MRIAEIIKAKPGKTHTARTIYRPQHDRPKPKPNRGEYGKWERQRRPSRAGTSKQLKLAPLVDRIMS